MISSFQELLGKVKKMTSKKVVIPGANIPAAIQAAIYAKKEDIADFLLIGDSKVIKNSIKEEAPELEDEFSVEHETEPEKMVQKAVVAVKEGRAEIILKGKTSTSQLLKGVLDKDNGLQTGRILSDVFVFEARDRLTLMTDGGIVLYPELKEKIAIIQNAVDVAHSLGNENPKVALLGAIEVPNPKMPCTMDAAVIAKMNERGQIKGCTIDGPFALDNAISEEAAKIKKVKSPVAGKADILIVPNIESGNIFGKALTYYGNIMTAHVVMGAKAPILITSRADDAYTKLYSIALGIISA
ncbi:MAG: bifunctional enoyl-CoA hydratase/phosphate acetyltransferase [Candidatus Cloacimonadota bacterium]|nr:bifunctional enoyl-CoA hydratase/phosphate acetyltransferase [Candidatus Cloacimonadota bacterium]